MALDRDVATRRPGIDDHPEVTATRHPRDDLRHDVDATGAWGGASVRRQLLARRISPSHSVMRIPRPKRSISLDTKMSGPGPPRGPSSQAGSSTIEVSSLNVTKSRRERKSEGLVVEGSSLDFKGRGPRVVREIQKLTKPNPRSSCCSEPQPTCVHHCAVDDPRDDPESSLIAASADRVVRAPARPSCLRMRVCQVHSRP